MHEVFTDEARAAVDAASTADLLREWRFAPLGTFDATNPRTHYVLTVLGRRRVEDPVAWTAASKEVGWQ